MNLIKIWADGKAMLERLGIFRYNLDTTIDIARVKKDDGQSSVFICFSTSEKDNTAYVVEFPTNYFIQAAQVVKQMELHDDKAVDQLKQYENPGKMMEASVLLAERFHGEESFILVVVKKGQDLDNAASYAMSSDPCNAVKALRAVAYKLERKTDAPNP